jgi:phosphatidylglycerol:prolipoprotein diacylglycerol transferase
MFILACLIGTYLSVKAAEKKGIPIAVSLNVIFIAFIFTILGARLYFIVQYYQFFLTFPSEIFKLWKGGFSSYGGMIGGSLSVLIYLWKKKIPVWKFADCCAIPFALGVFLTRIGCFMNGCCFGKISNIPWAISFPRGSAPYMIQISSGQISPNDTTSLPVHPTQLYYSFGGLIILFVLLTFQKKMTNDGHLFLLFITLYSVSRFIIEFYRWDLNIDLAGILSYIQFFSIAIAIALWISYYLFANMRRK